MVNSDTVSLMLDDEIYSQLNSFKRELEVTKKQTKRMEIEIDICYLQRELGIRSVRSDCQRRYVRQLDLEAREAEEYERTLPLGDFDNSALLYGIYL